MTARKQENKTKAMIKLEEFIDREFEKYASVGGYGQLAASFNYAEFEHFVKDIHARVIDNVAHWLTLYQGRQFDFLYNESVEILRNAMKEQI